MEYN